MGLPENEIDSSFIVISSDGSREEGNSADMTLFISTTFNCIPSLTFSYNHLQKEIFSVTDGKTKIRLLTLLSRSLVNLLLSPPTSGPYINRSGIGRPWPHPSYRPNSVLSASPSSS